MSYIDSYGFELPTKGDVEAMARRFLQLPSEVIVELDVEASTVELAPESIRSETPALSTDERGPWVSIRTISGGLPGHGKRR